MIYILGIVGYLAIGGLLAGVFEDIKLDDFLWYLLWPFLVLMYLIILIETPFQNFGSYIITKTRQVRNRKK